LNLVASGEDHVDDQEVKHDDDGDQADVVDADIARHVRLRKF
jgi:hypothetical protein